MVISTRGAKIVDWLRSEYRCKRAGAIYWTDPPAGALLLRLADEAFFGRWVWPVIASPNADLESALTTITGTPERVDPGIALSETLVLVVYGGSGMPASNRELYVASGCRLVDALGGWTADEISAAVVELNSSSTFLPSLEDEERLLKRLERLGYL